MLRLMRSPERGIASSVEGGCERRAVRRGWPPRTACRHESIRKPLQRRSYRRDAWASSSVPVYLSSSLRAR